MNKVDEEIDNDSLKGYFYVSFQQAKILKLLGFNYPCKRYYDCEGNFRCNSTRSSVEDINGYIAPNIYDVHKWAREVLGYQINIMLVTQAFIKEPPYWTFDITGMTTGKIYYEDQDEDYFSYDETLFKAIMILFKVLKSTKLYKNRVESKNVD